MITTNNIDNQMFVPDREDGLTNILLSDLTDLSSLQCLKDFLSIKCYICDCITNSKNIILFRKTGRKLFCIVTNCNECSKFKSKVFCDSCNKLPYNFYNIIQNNIYIYI